MALIRRGSIDKPAFAAYFDRASKGEADVACCIIIISALLINSRPCLLGVTE